MAVDERTTAQEVEFVADGLTLRGKYWPGHGQPILALHGWMDNAASFDSLAAASALQKHPFIALDLHGHGLSDHKPPSGSYGIWEDLRGLAQVTQQLRQDFSAEQLILLGHSRGAIVASLLAATLPDQFSHLICLDGFVADAASGDDLPEQLRRHIVDFAVPPKGGSPCGDLERLVAARMKKGLMSDQAARRLVERNTELRSDGQRYWRSDRRLALASPVKLVKSQWQAVVDAITVPTRVFAASRGLGPRLVSLPITLHEGIEVVPVDGDHHCHMEAEMTEELATQIAAFCRQR